MGSAIMVLYFIKVLLFLVMKKMMSYCLLLICNSLLIMSLVYFMSGYSWYSLLMYLVYVGGVYMLFMFMTIHLPNNFKSSMFSLGYMFLSSLIFWEFFSISFLSGDLWLDNSFKFCSGFEGYLYLYLCCFLMVSFYLVSLMNSSKEGFMR